MPKISVCGALSDFFLPVARWPGGPRVQVSRPRALDPVLVFVKRGPWDGLTQALFYVP